MRHLFHTVYFWVIAGVTLVVVGLTIFLFFPPVIAQVRSNHSQIKNLDSQVAENEQFLATIKALESQKAAVDNLHKQAILSLPETASPEILILQLDGLLKSLALDKVAIDVPLAATTKKEGAEAETKFTLTGPATFDQTKQLITKLRSLSRWNKLTEASFTKVGDQGTLTIAGKAFSKPLGEQTFSGDSNIVAAATKLFSSFQAYTTVPDVKSEGSFGKTDPFGN